MDGKVLIIDDDARNIFALSAVLKAKGYHCISAIAAEDGLRLIEKDGDIKIVLLDMMMPELDGYETLNIIRNGPRRTIPVVAVTAQAMMGDREKCLDAGADDYIAKPIDIDHLLRLLDQYVRG